MRAAIFNGCSFHFEMFGYILYYCKENNIYVDIFTNMNNEMGWIEFYRQHFNNFQVIAGTPSSTFDGLSREAFDRFISNLPEYEFVFLTTDDDWAFSDNIIKEEHINKKVICINHKAHIRRPKARNHISTRPFLSNPWAIDSLILHRNIHHDHINARQWAIPCYPIINKKIIESKFVDVAIIGPGTHGLINCKVYNTALINRLCATSDKPIRLHIISRDAEAGMTKGVNSSMDKILYKKADANQLVSVVSNCHYVMTDVGNPHSDTTKGYSMSGAIPLAYSCLSKLIISKDNNRLYKFKNCIEFDIDSKEKILLSDANDKKIYDSIAEERKTLVSHFAFLIREIFLHKNV